MIKEELNKQLFNKIKPNAKIAIFGASTIGGCILKDICNLRKDVEVICFIDSRKRGTFWDLPIYGLKEFFDKNFTYDQIIVASLSAQYTGNNCINDTVNNSLNNVLDIYGIDYIPITKFILDLYNGEHSILNEENYNKAISVFSYEEDKNLFDTLFRTWKKILPEDTFRECYKNANTDFYPANTRVKKHYLEKINKEKIETIFDIGFNLGFNAIAYRKLLPNYKCIYAFETIYEYCRDTATEEFFMDNTIKMVNYAVGEN